MGKKKEEVNKDPVNWDEMRSAAKQFHTFFRASKDILAVVENATRAESTIAALKKQTAGLIEDVEGLKSKKKKAKADFDKLDLDLKGLVDLVLAKEAKVDELDKYIEQGHKGKINELTKSYNLAVSEDRKARTALTKNTNTEKNAHMKVIAELRAEKDELTVGLNKLKERITAGV